MTRSLRPVAVAVVVACAAPAARAQSNTSVEACAAAAGEGQAARRQGHLLDALKRFSACSQPSCPSVVQVDCVRWGVELDAAVPSAVIAVRDARGSDVLDATLTLDGAVVPIDVGRALRLDPGKHAVAVVRGGVVVARADFVLREGEIARRIDVLVPEPAGAPEKPRPPLGRTLAPWITAGGVTLGLVGGAFAWSASERFRDLDAQCAPRCAPADVDGVRARALTADLAIGAGVVAVAVGLYFLLVPPADAPPERVRSSARARVTPGS